MSLAKSAPPADFNKCLDILGKAIGCGSAEMTSAALARRVIASENAQSPDEGLALLGAYVTIADRDLRQAILDALLAISCVVDPQTLDLRVAERSSRPQPA